MHNYFVFIFLEIQSSVCLGHITARKPEVCGSEEFLEFLKDMFDEWEREEKIKPAFIHRDKAAIYQANGVQEFFQENDLIYSPIIYCV